MQKSPFRGGKGRKSGKICLIDFFFYVVVAGSWTPGKGDKVRGSFAGGRGWKCLQRSWQAEAGPCHHFAWAGVAARIRRGQSAGLPSRQWPVCLQEE